MWSYVHIWAGAGEFWGCVYLGSPNSVFNGGVHDVLNIIFLMALTPQGHIEEHICMDVCGYWSILICCSAVFLVWVLLLVLGIGVFVYVHDFVILLLVFILLLFLLLTCRLCIPMHFLFVAFWFQVLFVHT